MKRVDAVLKRLVIFHIFHNVAVRFMTVSQYYTSLIYESYRSVLIEYVPQVPLSLVGAQKAIHIREKTRVSLESLGPSSL